jgi:sn-glycerol 3-phosphate transport system ATP-binding protein
LFTLRIEGALPPPKVGEVVRLGAAPSHVHWFDPASGQRVG